MPIKVLPHVTTVNGGAMSEPEHQLQSSPSDQTGTEGAQSRGGRIRKRLHKSPSSDQKSLKHAETSPSTGNEPRVNATASTIASRQRPSLRNRVPSGARPLVRSPSKYTSNDSSLPTKRSVSSGIKPVPRSRQSSFSNDVQNSFSREASGYAQEGARRKNTAPFLPEVNFDDLHTSIMGEPNFYDLAASTGGLQASSFGNAGLVSKKESAPSTNYLSSTKLPEPRISRNNSLVGQQGNNIRQKVSAGHKVELMGPPSLPAAKQRRQSHFPTPLSSSSVGRAPRKSIGPGILPNSTSEYSFLRDPPPKRLDRDQAADNRSSRVSESSDNQISARSSIALSEDVSIVSTGSGIRRKSIQNSTKTLPDFLHAAPSTPDNAKWARASIHSSRSPARDSHISATTTSSGKRSSMMPGHATGLGARTISPTDARRMKRLSMMPNAPPVPHTPPMSLSDSICPEHRSIADSPSLIPRKSVTPTSSRTTPDVSRKSLGSVIPISSNTSFSSLRALAGAPRLQHSSTTSRLPTLKSRPEVSVNGEGVPPVPAIPKAYESPKNEQDIPFFAPRKSSLPYDTISNNSASTAGYVSTPSNTSSDKEAGKGDLELKSRQALTLIGDTQNDERASGAQNGRRTLQAIRLPPLNLLPLRTSTAEKIASLQERGPDPYSSPVTPPPRRGPPKTPSTPMTASKANFFSRNHNKEGSVPVLVQARSSSSHYAIRTDIPAFRTPSNSSNTHGATEIRGSRKAASPFLSSSLPKSSSEYNFLRSKQSTDRSTSTAGVDVKPSRLTGPRAQTSTKASESGVKKPPMTPSTDTEPSFGTTLRRKLSLTRKRSNSKTDADQPPRPPDHQTMPPPKLPASATWNGSWLPSSSPTQRPTYLHSRRKSSHPEALTKHDRTRSDISLGDGVGDKGPLSVEATSTNIPSRTQAQSSSFATNTRAPVLNGLPISSRLQAIDTQLDRDDILAEEEMKKLASKRRNTETAARELDELRRKAVPKDGVSPSRILRSARCNVFERGEIVDYPEVWFFGTKSVQKIDGDVESDNLNHGYDDERGDYNIILGDHLGYRYEVVDVLGKGSFGQVVRCIDYKTGGLVAIKIIRNKKRFHQQALVEVEILKKLRDWDPNNKFSMVNFTHSFYFRNHLCISTELLGMNLYEFIKIHDFKGFSLKLIRRFTKQLLNSLVLLKSHKVIHCDLKPENILLAHPAHSEIKVIDFGSSCLENEKVYTYIQSRFYRSPEVILGMSYGMPIDMWSLGCILAELLTGYPIFPGENEQEQLACIMEVFGPPDKHLIEKSSRRKLFFDSLGKPRLTVSSKGKRRRPSSKTLQQSLKCNDEPFLDFLSRCLRWDPERRMKPDEAIHHEFVTGIKPTLARNLRSLPQSSTNSSPIKRFNSMHSTSGSSRPLPEPPTTAFKSGTAIRNRDALSGSPSKPAAKRHSTVTMASGGLSVGAKKGVSVLGPNTTTTLSKPSTRALSGRPDLASAAATAAILKPR